MDILTAPTEDLTKINSSELGVHTGEQHIERLGTQAALKVMNAQPNCVENSLPDCMQNGCRVEQRTGGLQHCVINTDFIPESPLA